MKIFLDDIRKPPKIKIHSANISARRRMELAVTNINKLRR